MSEMLGISLISEEHYTWALLFYKPESCVKNDHIFNLSIFFMADVKASLYKKLAGNFSVGLLSDVVSSLGTSNKRERNVAKVMR